MVLVVAGGEALVGNSSEKESIERNDEESLDLKDPKLLRDMLLP